MTSRLLINRVSTANTALFVCDIQEKFSKTVNFFPQIVNVSKRMIDTARILEMPMLATEQYPKGLGRLVPELGIDRDKTPIFEKTCFSMVLPQVDEQLKKWASKSVILCGIETHACIYQTAIDLLENGYEVTVVADACSSRNMTDRLMAFRQLERGGALLSTSECVILSLLRDAAHPKFKEVQKVIMEESPDSGLVPHLTAGKL